ncbi:RagB/SusD family nutrient uptake outer membrane protein [Arundinibacter roseus]|uniref:RagB/SusD family nutrient uptake outer membrane protein n=1 Tax=Arundinibacter roseus TaxID=2070510 RepID=A0A4R4K824_9BACT|nr:RagB/SusD family nutrient uptake outer membrane protein [Arundinibacter roseus]TDB62696.1 RagB/SusD family nutrient uptake outer membrane protein [Arundinibacter roseus]
MKRLLNILLIAIFITSGHSCIDLEEDVSSILDIDNLRTENDVIAALTPIYRQMQVTHRNPQNLRTPTFGADDITTWEAGNKAPLRVFDRFDYGKGENAEINWLADGWNNYWRIIYFANTLIHGLKTSPVSESVKNIADAEARFLRAMSYFNLVRTHGNVPIILDGNQPTGEEVRATVLANYLQIESDLLIAEAALPSPGATSNVGRASSAAAKTLLADLYLTWGGWPLKDNSKYALAAAKAKEVIDRGYHKLLPIDQLWLLSNQNSLESIFAVQFSKTENMTSFYPTAFSFHEARGFSDIFPELQFFRSFPEGPRKQATFATQIPQRGVAAGVIVSLNPAFKPWQQSQRAHPMYKKFTISEDLTVATQTFGFRAVELYRYAEVLLIYAEAQARIGETASSIEALNQVKRRAAGLPYLTPNPDVDRTTATPNEIVDERGWELAGECKRWFDLVRTERVEEIAALRDPAENVKPVRSPTKEQYIAPIPFQAISTSKITQNPEGFKIQ